MGTIIRNNQASPAETFEDTWTVLPDGADIPAEGDVLLSIAQLANASTVASRAGRTGVLVQPEDDIYAVPPLLEPLDLVAIAFPKFADGRGYSFARILRDEFAYKGPLRAVGDIQHDQLFYYLRCGFDEFALNGDKSVEYAIANGFDTFNVIYQPTSDGRPAVQTPGNEVF